MSRTPKPLPAERLSDGAARYVSLAGDVLDHLCWRHYGREWDTTEAVLTANPGLAERGPTLPAGIVITLPYLPIDPTPRRERRRLFD